MMELPAPVREAVDAANSGDTDAFLATFTPATGFVTDWGREYHGVDAIRQWSDEQFIGQNVRISVIFAYASEEGDVVVIAQIRRDEFDGPCTYTFRIKHDTLAMMSVLA